MSSLSISNITTNSFYWNVSGLTAMSQQTFLALTTTNYGSSYSGQINDPFVVEILAVNATSISSTYYSEDNQYLSFKPGDSFTVYAYRYTDKWYRAGYQSVTIPSSRPDKFYWDTPKTSGLKFNIKASEWNRLIQNVKDMHVYKLGSYNSSQYPMSNVSSGQQFYASRFNEVRFAIGSLISTGINNKYKGDTIYASELNILKDKLNQIN